MPQSCQFVISWAANSNTSKGMAAGPAEKLNARMNKVPHEWKMVAKVKLSLKLMG
jgi:hypothetical protein